MNATIHDGLATRVRAAECPARFIDPLDHDEPGDETFVATRRALCRVAMVAAEAGARFQRDGVGVDPMAWMLAPRRMFGGAAPIEACMRRDEFVRGIIVHGLALDLDMDASEIDGIIGGEAGEDQATEGAVLASDADASDPPAQRLFTATVVSHDGFETVHAFHASLAVDEAEIAGRLYCRMGAACADASIVDGFDAGDPMVEALVAPTVADTLRQVAADPLSPLAAGLDLNIEQRFLG